MDNKKAHLEMIQGVINRMAHNSFLLKGWSVTLVTALLVLSTAVEDKIALITISLVPLIIFWVLDGYYLWQERVFRATYDSVRVKDEKDIDFSMRPTGGGGSWLSAMFSKTILIFYIALLIAMAAAMIFLISKSAASGV